MLSALATIVGVEMASPASRATPAAIAPARAVPNTRSPSSCTPCRMRTAPMPPSTATAAVVTIR